MPAPETEETTMRYMLLLYDNDDTREAFFGPGSEGLGAEVDAVLAQAAAAGGTITRPSAETFWGGYSGVFTDPDDHAWEVAHNPHWTIAADGAVHL